MSESAEHLPFDPTLDFYNRNADAYVAETMPIDMSETYRRFEAHLAPGASILDLGCGSGRDSRHFMEQGFTVTSVDGAEEFCRRASILLGIPVRCLLFQDLDYVCAFDAVWASASLLHVPKSEIGSVMGKVAAALKPNGVFFASFKYGETEREAGGRRYSDYTEKDIPWLTQFDDGLQLLEYWISESSREERAGEQWLNMVFMNRKGN